MSAATDWQLDEPSSDRACSVIDAIQQIRSEWRLVVLYDSQEAKRFKLRRVRYDSGPERIGPSLTAMYS